MVQYQVQDKLNETDKKSFSKIDILSYYWKLRNGVLKVKVTGLYTAGGEAIMAEDVKADLPRCTGTVNN